MAVRPSLMKARSAAGFSLIEVMIAMGLLVVALFALLSMFSYSMATSVRVQDDLIAKQKAREALESIYTARNTGQLAFSQIQNVASGGIFVAGQQPLKVAGADGLIGTGDDGDVEPGLANFRRAITIDPILNADMTVNRDLRKVTVTVQYPSPLGRGTQSFQLTSYISRFR